MNTINAAASLWSTPDSHDDAPTPDNGSVHDGSGPAARSSGAAQPATRVKRADTRDNPDTSSDAFADDVLRIGAQTPLSDEQMYFARIGIVRSVVRSRPRLADRQTTDMISNTLLDAMQQSPTFRALVSYSVSHGGERLENLRYRNEYSRSPSYAGPLTPIGQMSISYLRSQNGTEPMPIAAETEACGGWENIGPYVNLGAAPNPDTPAARAWQGALMHEIVHHLAGSGDPPPDSWDSHMGPTELIARRIASDMGWQLPSFRGYADPARIALYTQVNRTGLLDTAQRHAGHEHEFFERLENISDARNASDDFNELDASGATSGVPHHTPLDLPDRMLPGDAAQLHFHDGEVSFFPFADSAPMGKPEGYRSAYDASRASWETQGRFFQYGEPVGGNPHVRQFNFPDGSKAVITAHQPTLASSDLTGFEKAMTVGGATVGGAVIGFVGSGGNPAGAYLGGTAGAAAGAAIAAKYPYDRIWQGYDLKYYNKGETTAFHTQYMYAWDSDWSRVGLLSRQPDSNLWPDYADAKPDKNWNWWTWKSGDAPARM
jgi:T3SS secreted effector NleC